MFMADKPQQPPVMQCSTLLPGISDMFEELGQFLRQSSAEQESIRRSNPNTGDSSINSSTSQKQRIRILCSAPQSRESYFLTLRCSPTFSGRYNRSKIRNLSFLLPHFSVTRSSTLTILISQKHHYTPKIDEKSDAGSKAFWTS